MAAYSEARAWRQAPSAEAGAVRARRLADDLLASGERRLLGQVDPVLAFLEMGQDVLGDPAVIPPERGVRPLGFEGLAAGQRVASVGI